MTTITITRTYKVIQVRSKFFVYTQKGLGINNPKCEICEFPFRAGDACGLVHVDDSHNLHICDPCTEYIVAKLAREA